MDPEIIAALRQSLALTPTNVTLRAHLAELLFTDGNVQGALEEALTALSYEPADLRALRLARDASGATGDKVRATGYARLVIALEKLQGTPLPEIDLALYEDQDEEDDDIDSTELAVGADGVEAAAVAQTSSGREIVSEADIDAFLADVLGSEEPTIKLADVGGLETVKARLRTSFLNPMQNPELRKAYGQRLRGGLLLYGPPGCGKTYLARAVAGELGAHFYSVGISDILDMWLGQSEQKLHEVFEVARRNTPCVLFFDEVDALGFKRSGLSAGSGARNVVAQLLTELDSIGSSYDGIFVLAATNQPWDVDPALRRPGRFDRTLLVLPPDAEARLAILEHHLDGRPLGSVDIAVIAAKTDGLSGADLRLLCDSAGELAMEAAFSSGAVVPIDQGHLVKAMANIAPSVRPWFNAARNFATFANQDGQYDDLLAYIKKQKWGFGYS